MHLKPVSIDRIDFCLIISLFIKISKDLRKRLYQRRQKKPGGGHSRSPPGGAGVGGGGRSRSRSRDQDRRR
jgi:hypothetical protein